MIIVVGTPGAGKSTVLAGLQKQRPGLNMITWGTLTFELAKAQGLVTDRDQLRKLPVATQKKLQKDVAAKLAKMPANTIMDTHASIKTAEGYWPGLPYEVLKKLKPGRLILIDAPTSEIAGRRKADPTRPLRDVEAVEEIERHKAINLAFLAAYSALTGAPVAIVMNYNNKLDHSIAELGKLVD